MGIERMYLFGDHHVMVLHVTSKLENVPQLASVVVHSLV
jgi:hypothetical protein